MTDVLSIGLNYIMELLIAFTVVAGLIGGCKRRYINKACISAIISVTFDSFAEYFIGSETSIVFINLIILYLFILCTFQDTMMNTIIFTALVFCFTMIIEVVVFLVLSILSLSDKSYVAILGNIITLIVVLLLSFTKVFQKLYSLISSRQFSALIAIINISSIMLMVNINNKLYPSKFEVLVINIFLPLGIIIFMNIVMMKEYIHQKKQENQLYMYQNYLPYINELIDQVRSRQHKFDNELQTIKGLPSIHSTYESLNNAITDYSYYIESSGIDLVLLKMNYKFLAALLFQKMHTANDKDINVVLNIPSPILYSIAPEYELVDLVGVLFDNMIEATPSETECEIKISSDNHRTTITTINPGPLLNPEMRYNFIKKGYSTKTSEKKQRGYGLYLVNEIVKKYDGKLFIENTEYNNQIYISISVEI